MPNSVWTESAFPISVSTSITPLMASDSANLNGVASHLISPISTLMPAETGANVTAAHVLTAISYPSSSYSGVMTTSQFVITGWAFTLITSGSSDTYNIQGVVYINVRTSGNDENFFYLQAVIDGNTSNPQATSLIQWSSSISGVGLLVPFFMTFDGLTAGSHTLQFYGGGLQNTTSDTLAPASTLAICQRIY